MTILCCKGYECGKFFAYLVDLSLFSIDCSLKGFGMANKVDFSKEDYLFLSLEIDLLFPFLYFILL